MDELKRPDGGRWSRARFALPYSFKPQLSLLEAAIAAIATFLRIFLGCLLSAIWGSYMLAAWGWLRGHWWRIPAILLMFGAFAASFIGLMLSISALARGVDKLRRVL